MAFVLGALAGGRAAPLTFGTGACTATISEASVDFGLAPLNTFATRLITVSAPPGSATQFVQVRLASGSSSVFSADGRVGPQPMQVQVSFTPKRAGRYEGSLEVRALDAQLEPCASTTVGLLAEAANVFELSRNVINFGFQQIEKTTSAEKVAITTNGATDFRIESSSPAFVVTPTKHEGPKNFTLTVTFTPDKTGNFTGNVWIRAVNSEVVLPVQTISLRGTGVTPPKVTSPPGELPGAKVGSPYRHEFQSTGGWSTVIWKVTGGSRLPPGLDLGSGGILTGYPRQAGRFTFEVEARDRLDAYDSISVSINVDDIVTIGGLLDSASLDPDRAIAPGAVASLFGLFDGIEGGPHLSAATPLPRELGKLAVVFVVDDGQETHEVRAPLFFASAEQVNLQVPWEAGGDGVSVALRVSIRGFPSLPFEVVTTPAEPGIFTLSGQGSGLAVAVNLDGSIAQAADCCGEAAARPVRIGEPLVLFGSGLGPLTPEGISGSSDGVLRYAVETPKLWIGDVEVPVSFAGEAPGLVGVNQINVLSIPDQVEPSDTAPIWLEAYGVRSQDEVTVAIAPASEPAP